MLEREEEMKETKKKNVSEMRQRLKEEIKNSYAELTMQRRTAVQEVKEQRTTLKRSLQDIREAKNRDNRAMVNKIKEVHKNIMNNKHNAKIKLVRKINKKKIAKLENLKKLDTYRLKILSGMELDLIKRLRNSQANQEKVLNKLKTTLDYKPTIFEEYKNKAKAMHKKGTSLLPGTLLLSAQKTASSKADSIHL